MRTVVTMGWTSKRRVRALLVALVFGVLLVSAASLALHYSLLLTEVTDGKTKKQVTLFVCVKVVCKVCSGVVR